MVNDARDAKSALLGTLLIATDGFASGDRAVSYGIALGAQHGSRLVFCCAIDPSSAIAGLEVPGEEPNMFVPRIADLETAASAILERAALTATSAGSTATSVMPPGRPVQAIVEAARLANADAIVVGTQSKFGLERFCMGSTADGVLRRANEPVFVINRSARDPAAPGVILVAVDGSPASTAAAQFAFELAATQRCGVLLCAVAETFAVAGADGASARASRLALHEAASDLLDVHAASAKARSIACETVVVDGYPVLEIPALAAKRHASLIVVGTHRAGRFSHLVLGSVAESVVRDATMPVAVIRGAGRALPAFSGR